MEHMLLLLYVECVFLHHICLLLLFLLISILEYLGGKKWKTSVKEGSSVSDHILSARYSQDNMSSVLTQLDPSMNDSNKVSVI